MPKYTKILEVQPVLEKWGTAGLNLPRRAQAPLGASRLPYDHVYIGRGSPPFGQARSKWANPFPLS
eukprot:12088360-Heterocapsa_arctica.AAC.1